jgi:threonine aldolase
MKMKKRTVEFRSDTFTKPTKEMRTAMFEAEVGDDVYGEDPTMNALEERIANLFGKEKAVFFPTGTMSNLTAVLCWCKKRGSEVILGNKSHIYLYEQGGISQFGGVSFCVLPNQENGTIDLTAIESSIKNTKEDFHYTTTELITVENTHNDCGGRILPLSYIQELAALCQKHKIPLHMDGARIWHTAEATGLTLKELTADVDSISACLSKGLGAPVGSVLVGPAAFIDSARNLRKALGGGMRQVGILAAAGMKALDDFERGMLKEDHRRAQRLVEAISKAPGIRLGQNSVDTNIILIDIDNESYNSTQFVERLTAKGLLTLTHGPKTIRIVVHRDISEEDIDFAIEILSDKNLFS